MSTNGTVQIDAQQVGGEQQHVPSQKKLSCQMVTDILQDDFAGTESIKLKGEDAVVGIEHDLQVASELEPHPLIMKLAHYWVEKSCLLCSTCTAVMLLLSFLSVGTGCMKMHMKVEGAWSVVTATDTQWLITYGEAQKLADKRENNRVRRLQDSRERRLQDFPSKRPEGYRPNFQVHYATTEGDDIFLPQQLQEMCRFEKVIVQSDVFKNYCMRTSASVDSCWNLVLSPLKIFYGEQASAFSLASYQWDCAKLSDATVEAKKAFMWTDLQAKGLDSKIAQLVTKSAFSKGNPLRSAATRSLYMLGTPSTSGVEVSEDTIFDPEVSKVEKELFKLPDEEMAYGPGGIRKSAYQVDKDSFTQVGNIRVRFNVPFRNDFLMIQGDFVFCFVSIMFVFFVMYYYLSSAFMAGMGMLQIILSMPLAGLFYQGVLQIKYFHFLHILTVFLALGIGADDIFVLTDAWRQTSYEIYPAKGEDYTPEQLKRRIALAYQRSFSAVLNTTVTTAMAFLSSSGSKVMPMRTNGWYATLVIFFLFIGVVTLTPAVLLVHQYRLADKRCCCPGWSAGTRARKLEDDDTPRKSLTARLLEQYYVVGMQFKYGPVKIVPLALLVISIGVAVQGVIFMSTLTAPLEAEEWFPDNHMDYGVMTYTRDTYYGQGDDVENEEMTLVLGISGLDREGFDPYRPYDNPGTPIFNSQFDLSTSSAQTFILDTCNQLRALSCSEEGCYGGKMVKQSPFSVACPLENFKEWLADEYGMGSLPTGSQFKDKLIEFRNRAEPSENLTKGCNADWQKQIGVIDGDIKFFAIHFVSTMLATEALGRGSAVREVVKKFIDTRNQEAPSSASGLFVVAKRFASYDLSQELINGLLTGCAIAFPIAFIVLLYATFNIILALYAIAAVGSIVACVLGWCKSAQGWSLGVAESIAGVIVIGYSVDYVVHLAHMYEEAAKHGAQTRGERSSFAVLNMGSTVFAGAITTCGAGIFMLLCFSTFFDKMAKLITMTIFYSFFFSLGGFMSACYVIGPEYHTGNLSCLRRCGSGSEATSTRTRDGVTDRTTNRTSDRLSFDVNRVWYQRIIFVALPPCRIDQRSTVLFTAICIGTCSTVMLPVVVATVGPVFFDVGA